MTRTIIALGGVARSGKDTVADRLVRRHGYTRVAFADRVRDLALAVDPLIVVDLHHPARLSSYVGRLGWDEAKQHPEVRRTLQAVGQGVRDVISERTWIRLALSDLPDRAVITDLRYANEAAALRSLGATIVRVVRPGAGLPGAAGEHPSETDLDVYGWDETISNVGDLDMLHRQVDRLAMSMDAEARRAAA